MFEADDPSWKVSFDGSSKVHESSHEKIVLFDFDRTITRRDTVISFVVRCGRLRRLLKLSLKAILNNPRPIFARDRDFIKESVVTAALADLTQDVLLQAAELHEATLSDRQIVILQVIQASD